MCSLSLFYPAQVIDNPTLKCGHGNELVVVRPVENIHRKAIATDSIVSDNYCDKSSIEVSVSSNSNTHRRDRNIANIGRSSFITELSSVSLLSSVEKANQYSDVLRTVLDMNASSSLRNVKNHNNSTWFE